MQIIKSAQCRTTEENRELVNNVAEIIHQVRKGGDAALIEYNTRYDQNTRRQLRISREEIQAAYQQLSAQELADLRSAADHIRIFAEEQRNCLHPLQAVSPIPGMELGHHIIPVDACCCYVPGGRYPLYSSALMLAIPACVAGVNRVCACSPTLYGTASIHPKTLVALDIAGVDEIYAVGGAHAIAAFSYGTDQIAPVDMIVGPGNQYVTEAKRQCYGQVGIDFVAGPSEVLVIADGSADPQIIAADLLAQSEHDLLAKGVLITTSESLARETIRAVEEQLRTLPTADVARAAWEKYGEVLLADHLEEAVSLSNDLAPEHLEIMVAQEQDFLPRLTNYGSLFIGKHTAEVFGDYVSGTNHTLPTLRAARYTGGVWAGTFLKVATWQRVIPSAMKKIAPVAARLAHGEGLSAHARAAEIRMEKLEKSN